MNYETTYLIGNDTNTRQATGNAATRANRKIHQLDATSKRRQPDSKRQAKSGSGRDATHDFLRSKFLPKLALRDVIEDKRQSERTEKDFYTSLSKIANRHGITPNHNSAYAYPYNILLSLHEFETKLKDKDEKFGKLHVVQSKKKTFLAVKQYYNTQSTLYYIPVLPIYRMLHSYRHKHHAHLLLSVCSYLYKVVRLPYYRQEDSYLYWQYEIMNEWIYNDESEDECGHSELRQAEVVGDLIEKKIRNLNCLSVFKQRLTRFVCKDQFDQVCWQIASDAFSLYSEYPDINIFRNAPMPDYNPYDYDDYQIITMDKYISFCAETKGQLYSSIAACINNEFGEYGDIEEPTIYQPVDGTRIAGNDFDFEKRIFKLIEHLCDLLADY